MTKNQKQTSRKPATNFPNLRKKMEKQKTEKQRVKTNKRTQMNIPMSLMPTVTHGRFGR